MSDAPDYNLPWEAFDEKGCDLFSRDVHKITNRCGQRIGGAFFYGYQRDYAVRCANACAGLTYEQIAEIPQLRARVQELGGERVSLLDRLKAAEDGLAYLELLFSGTEWVSLGLVGNEWQIFDQPDNQMHPRKISSGKTMLDAILGLKKASGG
jgi:hypothetical protein